MPFEKGTTLRETGRAPQGCKNMNDAMLNIFPIECVAVGDKNVKHSSIRRNKPHTIIRTTVQVTFISKVHPVYLPHPVNTRMRDTK